MTLDERFSSAGTRDTRTAPTGRRPRTGVADWSARCARLAGITPEDRRASSRGSTRRSVPRPDLAYFWGEDAWSIDARGRDYRAGLEQDAGRRTTSGGRAVTRTTASAESRGRQAPDRVLDDIAEHLAIAPLFAAGTLVVVRQPGSLLRETAARERLMRIAGRGRSGQRAVSSSSCSRQAAADRCPAGRAARHDRGARRHGQGLPGADARANGGLDRRARAASSTSGSRRGRAPPGRARRGLRPRG